MRTKQRRRRRTRPEMDDSDNLSAQISLCFMMLGENKTFKEIAELSGLSYGSVWNLFHGGGNTNRRYSTINKLAKAAGLRLDFVSGTVELERKN